MIVFSAPLGLKAHLQTVKLRFESQDTESTHPCDTSGRRTVDLRCSRCVSLAGLPRRRYAQRREGRRSDIDTAVEENSTLFLQVSPGHTGASASCSEPRGSARGENGLLCGIAFQRPSAMTLYVCNVGHPDDDRRSETFLPVRTDLSTRLTRVDPGVLGDL